MFLIKYIEFLKRITIIYKFSIKKNHVIPCPEGSNTANGLTLRFGKLFTN